MDRITPHTPVASVSQAPVRDGAPVVGAVRPAPADARGRAALRPSDRSFFARIKRWLSGGGTSGAQPAAPASLLARLRPPSTGRFSLFFGRLSRLDRRQYELAVGTHRSLRGSTGGMPPALAGAPQVPRQIQDGLGRMASRKPDEIFDEVCRHWTGSSPVQAAALQQEALAFLRASPSHDAALLSIKAGLREAPGRQSSAQVEARAQAIYAALVGSAQEYATTHAARGVTDAQGGGNVHPLDALAGRIGLLERRATEPETLLARVRELAGIQVGLEAQGLASAGDERLGALQTRCQALRKALQAEIGTCLRQERDTFIALPLREAAGRAATHGARVQDLRESMDTLLEWDAAARQGCDTLATSLQDHLDAVAQSGEVLERYDAIQDLDPQAAGATRAPCAPLADYLRQGTVASYREVQQQIDQICVLAGPHEHVDLLAALGAGIVGVKGEVQRSLIQDLVEGKPQAVDTILRGAQWDDVAGALKLAGVDQREQAALAQAGDDPARSAAIAQFDKERFATGILHKRRVLNTELNRLVALKDPSQRVDLLGLSGAMAGASEAAIGTIRAVAGDLGQEVDVLLVNWIYCSCLDPATLDIDQPRVRALWKALKGESAALPGLGDAEQFLEQGFRSFQSMRDVHKRIDAFSRLLADAEVLAAASHDQDPRVRAMGLVSELHARLTGQEGVDPGDEAFSRLLKQRVEAERQAWTTASGPVASKLLGAVDKRNALQAKLQGQGWHFDLAPNGQLRSTIEGTSVSQHEQLRRVAQCLGVVAFIREQGAAQTAEGRALVADLVTQEFQPLAAQLRHFDPVGRRFRSTSGDAPELGQMMRLLGDQPDLEALLQAGDTVARLSVPASQGPASTGALEEVAEGVARIAVLQEAIANGNADFRVRAAGQQLMPADSVLRRLDAYGLSVADPIPGLARVVAEVPNQMVRQAQDMGSLCKRLDPVNPSAQGVVQARVPGAPSFASGAKGLLARAQAYVKAAEVRRRLDNQHAVAQRFSALEAGQSFDIHVGQRGEFTLGYPVAPGVSVSAGVSVGLGNGIRISRTGPQSYEVDVARTKSGALSGALSVLGGALTGSTQRSAEAARGFRIACASRQEAVELVEALVGVRTLDPARWTSGQVQELRTRGRDSRAAIQGKFELSGPADLTLLALEAQLDKSSGAQVEITQSPFIRLERRTQTRAWHASAGGEALGGRLAGETERGAQVSVTRTCARRGGLLRGAPGLAVRAQVVGDDIRGSVLRAMPHLSGATLDHYVEQVEAAVAAAAEAGQSVDVELECAMTPQGVRKANQHYRLAAELLRAPGQERAVAESQARKALREADFAMREPSHYVIRGVNLVLQSSAESVADGHGGRKETARVGAQERRALPLPASGAGAQTSLSIHAGYGALLDASAGGA